MAKRSGSPEFDPTNFEYNVSSIQGSIQPPSLALIHSGFSDYRNYNARTGTGIHPFINPDPDFSNGDYIKYLANFYRHQLKKLEDDLKTIEEADKILKENPSFARMLDLHKRGLL